MWKYILLPILIFFSFSSIAQTTSTAPVVNNTKTEARYVIGITNQDASIYTNVLKDLQNNSTIKVYAICQSHRIIGITVQTSEYSSYEELKIFFLNEYPTIELHKKDDSIFSKDCKDEILKQ